MAKSVFSFEGVEYSSKVKCAVALLESGRFKNQSEAAKAVGINPATVNANYGETGKKAAARRATYQALKLGKTGKYSPSMIAERTGLSPAKVVSILKSKSVVIVTKEQVNALRKAKEAEKAPKTKKVKVDVAPAQAKAKKAKKVKAEKAPETPVVEPVIEDSVDAEIPMDLAAMEAAKADMATA